MRSRKVKDDDESSAGGASSAKAHPSSSTGLSPGVLLVLGALALFLVGEYFENGASAPAPASFAAEVQSLVQAQNRTIFALRGALERATAERAAVAAAVERATEHVTRPLAAAEPEPAKPPRPAAPPVAPPPAAPRPAGGGGATFAGVVDHDILAYDDAAFRTDSFRLIFGRAIISRNGLEARMLFFFGTRAHGTLTLKRR